MRELYSIEYWQEFYKNDRLRTAHLEMIENVESGKAPLYEHWDINWLIIGTYFKKDLFVKTFLELHGVSDTLTLKEQLAYIQLMRE